MAQGPQAACSLCQNLPASPSVEADFVQLLQLQHGHDKLACSHVNFRKITPHLDGVCCVTDNLKAAAEAHISSQQAQQPEANLVRHYIGLDGALAQLRCAEQLSAEAPPKPAASSCRSS